jgi:hypothetical protein
MVLYMLKNKYVWLIFAVLFVGYFAMDGQILGFTIWEKQPIEPVSLESFARSLTESGAKMYGAYWCGHCNSQKKMFGDAWQFIDYVECSEQDGSQSDQCAEAGIKAYPTWEFGDGTRLSGALSFETLAEGSGVEI